MLSRTRRSVLGIGLACAIAGCAGPDLTYDDESADPPTSDDDPTEFGRTELERITDFATASNAHLRYAEGIFAEWLDDQDAVDIDQFDELRRDSTALLDTYWRQVVPYEDDLSELDRGSSVNGLTWAGEGAALVDAFAWHEAVLDAITTGSIAIIDAGGEQGRVSQEGRSAIELVLDEAEPVVVATEAALPG